MAIKVFDYSSATSLGGGRREEGGERGVNVGVVQGCEFCCLLNI